MWAPQLFTSGEAYPKQMNMKPTSKSTLCGNPTSQLPRAFLSPLRPPRPTPPSARGRAQQLGVDARSLRVYFLAQEALEERPASVWHRGVGVEAICFPNPGIL